MAKITVIDDDHMICRMLGALLGNEGHEAWYVTESPLAMLKLMANVPDLIILDVMMPELDGIGLLRQIKKSQCLQDTKVVMYSASDDAEVSAESLNLGAAEFLQKGMAWEHVYASISQHLAAA